MRKIGIVALGVLLVFGGAFAFPVRSEQPNRVEPFMRLKLDHAQKVLEGIALEDFLAKPVGHWVEGA